MFCLQWFGGAFTLIRWCSCNVFIE